MSEILTRLTGEGGPVLVAGDLILDRYVWGGVERISPEAPVQVLRWEREQLALGGAANVAHNLAALGCSVRLAGIIGEDEEGERLEALTQEAGIDTDFILKSGKRPTVSKTRFIGRNQQILRVDREEDRTTAPQMTLESTLPGALEGAGGVICSDYLKGALSQAFMEKLVAAASARGIRIVADTKGSDYSKYRGVSAITPNLAEVSQATGRLLNTEEAIDDAAGDLIGLLGAEFVLITRGPGGMTLYGKEGRLANEPAKALEVYDVTGAGDTAAALFGLGLFRGLAPAEAVHIANLGAGVVVGKVGTAALTGAELSSALSGGGGTAAKLLDMGGIEGRLQSERAMGRKVVFTNGCFDLLHVGHIQYLQQAKNLGDLLVVGLNDDDSVRRVKGKGRPLIDEQQRAHLLSALECVDFVVFFPEDTPENLIQALRPDILVKGGDYTPDEVVGREAVESYGGRVEILPFVDGVSTTNIVNTILERYSGE